MEERYKTVKVGVNGTYAVYDTERKCMVLKSVTPQAKYNKQVCNNAVYGLNLCKLPDKSDEQN